MIITTSSSSASGPVSVHPTALFLSPPRQTAFAYVLSAEVGCPIRQGSFPAPGNRRVLCAFLPGLHSMSQRFRLCLRSRLTGRGCLFHWTWQTYYQVSS